MPSFKGSRYAGLDRTRVIEDRTKTFLHLRTLLTEEGFDDPNAVEYVVKEGDMLDALAYKYGGSETLWWIIAEVNGLLTPFDPVPGSKILIPSPEYFRSRSV